MPENQVFGRAGGVKIGKDCLLCSSPMTREPYLINIGNNVTVSTNVTFVTHDNSIKLLYPENFFQNYKHEESSRRPYLFGKGRNL